MNRIWTFMLLFKETRQPHCHKINKKTTKTIFFKKTF